MVEENNDLNSVNTMNSAYNVKLITDKKKFLEETTSTIQEEIRSSFDHLMSVLKSREKQLLRQVEAIHVQQLSLIQSNPEIVSCKPLLKVDLSTIYNLESKILDLGKLEVFGKNGITVKDIEPYKVQEYQEADKDHESFNKSIKFEENNDSIVVFKDKTDMNVSIYNDNTQICEDGILSCSCNSSLDSSNESENKSSGQEFSLLSISNCTIIEKELFTSKEDTLIKGEDKSDKKFKNSIQSLDSKNENLEIDLPKSRIEDSIDLKESKCCLNSRTNECGEVINSNFCKDINANKEEEESLNLTIKNCQMRRDSVEHPKQIQQWLQQILVETETEPMIHEIEQFSEISKARLSGQFPLET